MSDDALRVKLEGGEALLEVTRERYRQLISALSSRRRDQKLRELATVAREAQRADQQLRRTLARAVKHAEREGWPRGALSTLILEVRAADVRLRELLGEETLDEVVTRALTTPHRVTKTTRHAVLAALFPDDVFTRTADALDAFLRAPTVERFDALNTEDVEAAWRRLEAFDASLARWVHDERELPLGRAKRATEVLDGHVTDVLTTCFVAVAVTSDERVPCFRFCLARAVDGAARLPASPRSSLLMLSNELSGHPASRPALAGGRRQVLDWAREADRLAGDDWRSLRAWLRSLKPRRLLPDPVDGPERLVDLL